MPVEIANRSHTEADRAWFGEQVDHLLPELYGVAARLCPTGTDAEDLVAESVARAWEALPRLEKRDAFRAWVFRILHNAFVSGCRSAHAKAEHEPLSTTGDDFSLFERLHQPFLLWWGNPEQDFLNRLLRSDLERAIAALPAAFREVVVLVDVEGLSYRDVADTLDVPVGTVRSRLARGRSRLQAALWEHARDAGLEDGPAPANPEKDET